MSNTLGMFFILITLLLGGCSDKFWGCGQKITSNKPSPNGEYQIVFFIRDCGATTIPLGNIAIVSQEKFEKMDDAGYNIDRHEKIMAYERARVNLSWVSDEEVEISYQFDPEFYGRDGFVSNIRESVGRIRVTLLTN